MHPKHGAMRRVCGSIDAPDLCMLSPQRRTILVGRFSPVEMHMQANLRQPLPLKVDSLPDERTAASSTAPQQADTGIQVVWNIQHNS